MKLLSPLILLFITFCSLEAILLKIKDLDGILSNDEFDIFNKFLADNKKSCGHHGVDCRGRKGNFLKNLKKFNEIKKVSSFEVQMHSEMDLSDEELNSRLIPKDFVEPFPIKAKKPDIKKRSKRSIPTSYDWRLTGAVNAVKNQGGCGDCWAFATAGVVEILDNLVNCRINDTTRLSYSEQFVNDCTYNNASLPQSQQRNGCKGGSAYFGLDYVIKNGITLQSTAPYVSDSTSPPTSGVCKTTYSPQIKPIKDQWDFTNDVAGTMNYIATISPVAVALVVCADFNFYKSGIYNNASCNEQNSEGGHAMTMIGYGTENGVDYWLCRNSWGPTWGESGHVRIKRGANIATIESRGIYAPVPITAANKCTTSLDYYYDSYPNCQCTAAKTTAPSAPFTVQSQPGQTGCIPSKIQYNCTGSGKDVVGVILYDDSGKQIGGEMNYCYSKRSTDAPVVKCMTIPSGSSVNYGTYENSRVAYAVCQNWGPQGADWGC